MRIKIFGAAFLFLMLNVVLVHAQVEPCLGTDPDASCPLDTWVIVLAGLATIFASIRLYRKQSAQADGAI